MTFQVSLAIHFLWVVIKCHMCHNRHMCHKVNRRDSKAKQ